MYTEKYTSFLPLSHRCDLSHMNSMQLLVTEYIIQKIVSRLDKIKCHGTVTDNNSITFLEAGNSPAEIYSLYRARIVQFTRYYLCNIRYNLCKVELDKNLYEH